MEFDWSTFILEVVNFLILLWILKRFLYVPVLTVIRQRKAAVDQAVSEAQATRQESLALKQQYENRLVDWEREKEQAREQLREELAAERARLLEGLRQSLEQEREKARVLDQRRQDELLQSLEQQAVRHGGEFVARLLARLASPELEARIVEAALQDLAALSPDRLQTVQRALGEGAARVTSAFPLGEAQRGALAEKLDALAGTGLRLEFHEDPALVAGLRIGAGPWVLRANLADELGFFTEAASGA